MLQARTTEQRPLPRGSARAAALRVLAARRLTEAKLWERLRRKGFADDAIRDAVDLCKRAGYVDDALFAQLYVDGRRKAVGDARLVAELVKRGIDKDAARASVTRAVHDEDARIEAAIESLYRKRPELPYPNAARALERLGFPAVVYISPPARARCGRLRGLGPKLQGAGEPLGRAGFFGTLLVEGGKNAAPHRGGTRGDPVQLCASCPSPRTGDDRQGGCGVP